ncbi:hypothetical protein [Streptomyces europaeiscabiei]|uniref:hypothetical protein n=1 Tax=Streptomyces europaeiscabiei TaxID=146819 RepID=UPI0029BD1619|nr:hypothetical protein [Streptomyces europaeiscabiei]MDX3841691.1 hypothetical protein [Streptomyces europaeiscabiei]
MTKRLTAALATAGMAASLFVALPASAAFADDPMCNRGTIKYTWTDVKRSWVITHRNRLVNQTGGQATKTYKLTKVKEVGASVKATVGGKVSANIAIASLEEKIDLELAAEGKRTSEETESLGWKMKKNGTYVFYRGTEKVTGYYTQWRCDVTKWAKTGRGGKVQSWTIEEEGGLRCQDKIPKKGMVYAAKKKYC